jgi:hypothetical protein
MVTMKTKFVDNFHSMSLTVTDSVGTSLRIHVGASVRVNAKLPASVSGPSLDAIRRTMTDAINAIMSLLTSRKLDSTYGERMSRLTELAKSSASFGAFTTALGSK